MTLLAYLPGTFSELLKFIIVPLAITMLIASVLYSCCKRQVIKRQAQLKGPITSSPVIPQWLIDDSHFHAVKMENDVRIESRVDVQQRIKDGGHPHFNLRCCSLSIYWWLKYYLYREFGRNKFALPMDVCLVTVPMEGFRCCLGVATDFEQKSPKEPGHLMYQMCGNEAIQIAYYVTKDKVRVAGYTLYIPDGRADSNHYSRKYIEEFEIPEISGEKKDIFMFV